MYMTFNERLNLIIQPNMNSDRNFTPATPAVQVHAG